MGECYFEGKNAYRKMELKDKVMLIWGIVKT